MTQLELDEYLAIAIPALADELMRAHHWSAERSMAASIESFDSALPKRVVDSPNQFLKTIHAEGQRVGVLWYGVRKDEAFVWDILIYPAFRKKGHGASALAAMEGELRQMGVGKITLNVFRHNSIALHLYERSGFSSVSTRMTKQLC